MTNPVKEMLSYVSTGNADPILREIRHALAKLVETGESTTIDLGAIPFAAGDERILDEVLGRGEVQATLTAMGVSHIAETAIAGVWRVDHMNEEDEVQSRFVEVTYCPDILKTQGADAAFGLQQLIARLDARALARNGTEAENGRTL